MALTDDDVDRIAAAVWTLRWKSGDNPNPNDAMMGDVAFGNNIFAAGSYNATLDLPATLDRIEDSIAELQPPAGGLVEHRHEGGPTGGVMPPVNV